MRDNVSAFDKGQGAISRPNASPRPIRFSRIADIAEMATDGVCHHLDEDKPDLAAILQPVASCAWAVAAGEERPESLAESIDRGLVALDTRVGAPQARAFLLSASKHLSVGESPAVQLRLI